jgi:hypothetical protein
MPREDYALVSLLCGGDYDTVNLLQVSDYLSPHIICRQGCLAVVLQLHSGSHAVVWATPCSQLSQTANLLVRTVKHGEMMYNGTSAMTQHRKSDGATRCWPKIFPARFRTSTPGLRTYTQLSTTLWCPFVSPVSQMPEKLRL